MSDHSNNAHPFLAIVEMAHRLGVDHIENLPGCWEYQVDPQWWIAVNGHAEDVRCSLGQDVPPFSAYLVYNGWPAGLIDVGGGVVAAGLYANEQTFVAACARVGEVAR